MGVWKAVQEAAVIWLVAAELLVVSCPGGKG